MSSGGSESEQVFHHFSKYTSKGPHVNASGIMGGSQKNLECSIPKSNNLVSITLQWDSEGSSKTKVSNLENPLLLFKKKVLGFEITMEDAMTVAVGNAFAKLEKGSSG